MSHKLAFVGFGTVGQGLAEILLNKKDELREILNEDIQVVAISDAQKGSLYHSDGLDLERVLAVVREAGNLNKYPDSPELRRGWDSLQTIRQSNADTVIEVTFTNVHTGQPAIDHCREAFINRKNVVTTNKGPIALAYDELSSLAEKNGVQWGFEGTVMSGTPSLRMPLVSLAGNRILSIQGILNGTTNYILTKMEEGLTYDAALKQAQQNGFAEADPTSDVEGYDAMYKIIILAKVIMGVPLKPEEVVRHGIQNLTNDDILSAKEQRKRWKLIAKVVRTQHGIQASVQPETLDLDHPLASVQGVENAITYDCDLSGPVTLVGAGAGKVETGFALLIDIINLIRRCKESQVILGA